MTRRDARGQPVSTASAAAVDASERALWRMMSFYGTPIDDLDAAIATDPSWPLPHLMKAGFLLGLTEPSLRADAGAALATARPLVEAGGNGRERGHLVALQRLAAGDWAGAGAAWDAVLAAHPRDALALQWGHLFDFYRGDADALLGRVERVLPAWSVADALHPYVIGLHAFGLEESHRFDEAEAVGRQALAGPARVPWAIHAVAHVMEMQGRHDDGRRWLAEWRPHWGGEGIDANGFAGHLGWHEALFALETLDHAGALAVFDTYLHSGATEITLQRLDAASLLWRLMLQGADVGQRWQRLLDVWPREGDVAGGSAFNDAHVVMALLGAGRGAEATAWAERAIATAAASPGWNREVMADVGAPLLRGLLGFAAGRFDEATSLLLPLRPRLARFGGSRAQRDVVDQTLLAASAGGSDHAGGRILVAERRLAKPETPLTRYWAARAVTGP